MMQTVPQITALQAQALVNYFLSDSLPDRFTADQPQWSNLDQHWRVPIVLAYPSLGVLGVVGEVRVSPVAEQVIEHTAFEQMKQRGLELYAVNREAIETDVL
jgi:hypothetical protein